MQLGLILILLERLEGGKKSLSQLPRRCTWEWVLKDAKEMGWITENPPYLALTEKGRRAVEGHKRAIAMGLGQLSGVEESMFPDRITAVKALDEYARQLGKVITFHEPKEAAFYSTNPYREMVRVPYSLNDEGQESSRPACIAEFYPEKVVIAYPGTERKVRSYELQEIFNKLLSQKLRGLTNNLVDAILAELSGILGKQVCDIHRAVVYNEHGWISYFQIDFNFTGVMKRDHCHYFCWSEDQNDFNLQLQGEHILTKDADDPRAVKLKEVLERLVPK